MGSVRVGQLSAWGLAQTDTAIDMFGGAIELVPIDLHSRVQD